MTVSYHQFSHIIFPFLFASISPKRRERVSTYSIQALNPVRFILSNSHIPPWVNMLIMVRCLMDQYHYHAPFKCHCACGFTQRICCKWRVEWTGGEGGGLNLTLPVPFTPGSCLFVLFLLQTVMQC